jgi:hypothetical protein
MPFVRHIDTLKLNNYGTTTSENNNDCDTNSPVQLNNRLAKWSTTIEYKQTLSFKMDMDIIYHCSVLIYNSDNSDLTQFI